MATALLAAIATTQVITGRQNHQPVIQIVVLILDELDHFAGAAAFSHLSKNKRRAGAARSSRSTKTALEILAIKKVVNVTEEAQRSGFVTQWQSITSAKVRLSHAPESISTTSERHWIKDRGDIVAGRGEIKID